MISLWISIYSETSKCLLLSKGQTEAQDLLDKIDFIHSHLPEFLKTPTTTNNREAFVLKKNRAEIRALPSTKGAGHGFQGTLVIRDELSRHEEARENYRAVARSGAKMLEISTANKKDPANYFQETTSEFWSNPLTEKKVYPSGLELYTNEQKPGVCLVFLGWKLRPVRKDGLTLDEWWDTYILPRYSKEDIEEQFPATIEEVFQASVQRAYFEYQALDDMGYDICQPKKQSEINTYNNIIRVYKTPIVGRHYVVFTDPSDGVVNPFVTGVLDFVTGEVVCSATGMERADMVAKIHDYLVREYNDAENSYEYNASCGGTVFECLKNLKTPSQAPRRKTDGKIDIEKKGQTVSAEHKAKNFGDLAHAIGKRQLICHDREFMQQAKMVQRDGDKPIMERKITFDWVMMMVGLWQLQKYFMPAESWQPTTTTYKY